MALLAFAARGIPGAMAAANFRHYEPRCAHGSPLSAALHAAAAAHLGDSEMALRFLRQAATADLESDPNSAGGIDIAVLAGVWQAVVIGFAGLGLQHETISIDPRLPQHWRSVAFTVRWRGRPVQVNRSVASLASGLPVGSARLACTISGVRCSSLDMDEVFLLNDLKATAYAVRFLEADDLHTVKVGRAEANETIAVVAPGTGLREEFLVWRLRRVAAATVHGRLVSSARPPITGPATSKRADWAVSPVVVRNSRPPRRAPRNRRWDIETAHLL
jgi:hypothetical protein